MHTCWMMDVESIDSHACSTLRAIRELLVVVSFLDFTSVCYVERQ